MPTAENAELSYESGQTAYAMHALADSGDAKTFASNAIYFSGASGKEPNVKPDGLATGGSITNPASNSNNVVDITALSCYLAGVLSTVVATVDLAISRAATNVSSITSVTVNSSGAVIAVQGTDGTDGTFSETRGAVGGPPYIPVGSIEIGQVRLASNVAAEILDAEILTSIGVHRERYDSPVWGVNASDAEVEFNASLPLIHTGDLPKAVNASYNDPIFSVIDLASDYVPSENAHSINSVQIYRSVLGSTSKTLSQGTFTVYLNDGITDPIVKAKDDKLFFKFKQDKLKSPFLLDQGILGMSRAFPAGDTLSAACTISAEAAAVEHES